MSSRTELSYAHANMRLKTRYGFEITRGEWEAIGQRFQQNHPSIKNRRRNHIGDSEGWVEVNGIWVCAYYNARLRIISTFYARPPDPPDVADMAAKIRDEVKAQVQQSLGTSLEKRRDRCRRACDQVLRGAQQRAAEVIRAAKAEASKVVAPKPHAEREEVLTTLRVLKNHRGKAADAAFHYSEFNDDVGYQGAMSRVHAFKTAEEALENYLSRLPMEGSAPAPRSTPSVRVEVGYTASAATPEVVKKDFAWVKSKLGEAKYKIIDGDHVGAAAMLDAIAAMPKNLRPSVNPLETERWLASRIENERSQVEIKLQMRSKETT